MLIQLDMAFQCHVIAPWGLAKWLDALVSLRQCETPALCRGASEIKSFATQLLSIGMNSLKWSMSLLLTTSPAS
jgi:hypothetical protein